MSGPQDTGSSLLAGSLFSYSENGPGPAWDNKNPSTQVHPAVVGGVVSPPRGNTHPVIEQLRLIARQRQELQLQLELLNTQETQLRDQQQSGVVAPPSYVTMNPEIGVHMYQGRALTTITDILGQITEVAQDQSGCRFLQRKFQDDVDNDAETIVSEVCEGTNAAQLMADPFGNYLIQRIFEHGSEEQVLRVMRTIVKDIATIAFSMHGTRSVQKLIDCCRTQAQFDLLISSLRPNIIALIKDLNGNHVVQRCLIKLSDAHKQFIYDSAKGRLVEVATNRQGCCVLQRCVDNGTPEQREMLIQEILLHSLQLVQDPFANYVVQYLVDLNDNTITSRVIRHLLHNIAMLSCNKFSSNVIEKCMKNCPEDIRQLLIDELTDEQDLPQLLQDGFANYVIQTAITVASPLQFQQLADAIRPLMHLVRNSPYGKRLEGKLSRKPKVEGSSQTPSQQHPPQQQQQNQQRRKDDHHDQRQGGGGGGRKQRKNRGGHSGGGVVTATPQGPEPYIYDVSNVAPLSSTISVPHMVPSFRMTTNAGPFTVPYTPQQVVPSPYMYLPTQLGPQALIPSLQQHGYLVP